MTKTKGQTAIESKFLFTANLIKRYTAQVVDAIEKKIYR